MSKRVLVLGSFVADNGIPRQPSARGRRILRSVCRRTGTGYERSGGGALRLSLREISVTRAGTATSMPRREEIELLLARS